MSYFRPKLDLYVISCSLKFLFFKNHCHGEKGQCYAISVRSTLSKNLRLSNEKQQSSLNACSLYITSFLSMKIGRTRLCALVNICGEYYVKQMRNYRFFVI